jgi:serine/threonine protein kinase/tetratricopeptide (TPR) repeat protein
MACKSMSSSSKRTQSRLAPTFVVDVPPGFEKARTLKRQLLTEQRAGWDQGKPVKPEDLLPRWPNDPQGDPDVASLLLEDFLQRRQRGERPSVSDYQERFPEHSEPLVQLVAHHDVLRSVSGTNIDSLSTPLRLPEVGEEVFGFRLHQELGKGAFARVFLASQADLAGRPVVLKISAIEGTEPQTLAQLQHTHIVPIHSVHEDARAGLRAVCMPYFGGASLSRVLDVVWKGEVPPAQGGQLIAALKQTRSQWEGTYPETSREPETSTYAFLRQTTFVRAAVWITARLAEGLQHAHQRGVLHRDIKPSNILLSSDGQPLLLDFNLAQDQKADPAAATMGGTIAYMAPEQLRALKSRDTNQARQVDQRSDLYALGMVLFEMLTGQSPFDQSGSYSVLPAMIETMAAERSKAAPSLRQKRTDMAWSLESILRKCLAPDPAQRYQQAEHLAEDLRRFLEDQPLRHAPELSSVERLRKWTRRHPRFMSSAPVAALAGLLLTGSVAALAGVRQHLVTAEDKLGLVGAKERQKAFEEGTLRALCLVYTGLDLQDNLLEGIKVCETALDLYGVLQPGEWQAHPDWLRLDPEDRQRLAEDTRELLLVLAGARVQLAPKDPAALRGALALLDRAEVIPDLKESKAIWMERVRYFDELQDSSQACTARLTADHIPATSARDHYLLANSHRLKGGRDGFAAAIQELNQALRLNPRHYWSWMERGICYLDLDEPLAAIGDFGTCVGLWPEFSWGYFMRGWMMGHKDKHIEAIGDYTAALERDPKLIPAHMNRGLSWLKIKRFESALDDFTQALQLGKDDAQLHAGRGMALEGLGQYAEADEAFAAAFSRAASLPPSMRNWMKCSYGFAVATRSPRKARRAFDEVLRQDPANPEALYGSAYLAFDQEPLEEVLRLFNRALAARPEFPEARRYRALVLARLGSFEQAMQDINWCLERDPASGDNLYTAACIAARASERYRDTQAEVQALDLLKRAFARGVDRKRAVEDADLAAVRKHSAFQQLMAP